MLAFNKQTEKQTTTTIIIKTDNRCVALFSGQHKLTAIYSILRHFATTTKAKVHDELRTTTL